MARRRSARKPARKTARRRPPRAQRRKAPKRRDAKRPAAPRRPKARPGTITHTELASTDVVATRRWCAHVLGWKFEAPMPSPVGDYHMWRFENGTGGGLRGTTPGEVASYLVHALAAEGGS